MKRTAFLLLLIACAGLTRGAENRPRSAVILDETGVKNLGIELVESSETELEETVFALGRLEVLPGHRGVVSSRIPGRAIEVLVLPDHPIQRGEPAVVVESRQPGDPPPKITLPAPLSGLVSAVRIAPGQPVSPDEALAEIIDVSELYALARVPQHLAADLRPGLMARITVGAVGGEPVTAKLEHLGAEADAENGTVEAAFHLPNPEGTLRPGMRAEFQIIIGKREAVTVIPRAAVQGPPESRFVFVADYELKNAFVKAPVVLGAQNDQLVEITSGLLPGDQVVVRGAYGLSYAGKGSVSLKEALDAAHGHPHAEDGSELGAGGNAPAHAADVPGAAQLTPLTIFFAITTAVLFILLLASLMMRRSVPA
jgi:multidrug efflux pump subunit AcrA (membrane-fusion protein)